MSWSILEGDVQTVLRTLPADHFHCCMTSPPYWGLRDYGVEGQLGLEKSPEEYISRMVDVFRDVRRALRPDATLWLNIGDSYAGSWGAQSRGNTTGEGKTSLTGSSPLSARQIQNAPQFGRLTGTRGLGNGVKPKDLVGIPWMLAFALRADGWHLRSECIWHKPNAMVESVCDRPTRCHEQVFLLTRQPRYYYDAVAVMETATGRSGTHKPRPGIDTKGGNQAKAGRLWPADEQRNRRSVWRIPTRSFKGAHFATFPPALVEPCLKAGTSEKGCCANCGSPWVRQVKKERVPTRPGVDTKCLAHSDGDERSQELFKWNRPNVIGNRDPQRHVTRVVTTGWEAGCSCAASVASCRVLDPFAGAGTTVMVAARLGLDAVGIELNQEYARMAQERIFSDQPLFNTLEDL